ncbi:hypothetical protein ACH5RR_001562 [Cinchona calisaya]|uniref:Uncharacterized protein n=1 Tax=Cinchona calisaya TaxID=153742 RepID=A0ABD3B465_9GENT
MNMTFDSEEKAGEFYNRYANTGFQNKDLYNTIDAHWMKEVVGGDAEGAIGFLTAKKEADKMLCYKYDCADVGSQLMPKKCSIQEFEEIWNEKVEEHGSEKLSIGDEDVEKEKFTGRVIL